MEKSKTYYVQLNDAGLPDYPDINLFQIMTDDTIVFWISSESAIANKCRLITSLTKSDQRRSHKFLTPLNTNEENPQKDLLASFEPTKLSDRLEFHIQFPYSGSFFYQIEYSDKNFTKPDWILVHPYLNTPQGLLTADSLIIQTVLTRSLGKVRNWPKIIQSQANLGYNAIHLTPIQMYGNSGSLYAIKDQLIIDNIYFEDTKISSAERLGEVHSAIKKIQNNMLCFIDIVLNHTAVNSEWILEYPESAYNLHNSPHLKIAWELDKLLAEFSEEYAKGKVVECPYAPYIANDTDLDNVMNALRIRIKEKRLEQYFAYNKGGIIGKLESLLKNAGTYKEEEGEIDMLECIMSNSFGYGRKPLGVELDIEKIGSKILTKFKGKLDLASLWNELDDYLDKANNIWRQKYEEMIKEALENIEKTLRYEKLQLRNHKVSEYNPITQRYFIRLEHKAPERDPDEFIMIHNGWTKVTEDFASPLSFHYLKRSVVVWEDNIKLYYGNKKEDSPYLWNRMENYIKEMALIFNGFRIDNCHSTPLHVLEYFINYARTINESLFIFAEMFSTSYKVEAEYAKRAGINALMKESVYVSNAQELNDLLNRAIRSSPIESLNTLRTTRPKELVFDITHDNNSPMEIWNTQAILPLVCCLGMTNVAIGTTRGVDELWPTNISVMNEGRLYQTLPDVDENLKPIMILKETSATFTYKGAATKVAVAGTFNEWSKNTHLLAETNNEIWRITIPLSVGKYLYKFVLNDKNWVTSDDLTETDSEGNINNVIIVEESKEIVETNVAIESDIRSIRKIMNKLHTQFSKSSMSSYVKGDVIVIIQQLEDNTAYVLIARTNFTKGLNGSLDEDTDLSVTLPGKLNHIVFACNMYIDQNEVNEFMHDSSILKGVEGKVYRHLGETGLSVFAKISVKKENDSIDFIKMPSSFCLLVNTKFTSAQLKSVADISEVTMPPIAELSIASINHLLFRCNNEEQDSSGIGRSIYEFKGFAPNYAGIAGLILQFKKLEEDPIACKPIFDNITEGNWLFTYHIERLKDFPQLKEISNWLSAYLLPLSDLPYTIRPKLFVKVISTLYQAIEKKIIDSAPDFFKRNEFSSNLLLATYQFMGIVPSAICNDYKVTMANGLPYLSTDYMRCWGRHTMISLPGILLIPERLKEARQVLLTFASSMRHGLIPNLLSKGTGARFNSRDATWYFMEALQQYVEYDKENGLSIFKEKLNMIFLSSNQKEHYIMKAEGKKVELLFEDVIQQIMQSHYKSIYFTEWDAGLKIDKDMTSEGFNVNIWTDKNTGFIYGGNKYNCGTWMNKMGSSEKARNKGVAATPRDGANVEIIGLLKSTLKFLAKLYETNIFSYEGVLVDNVIFTYKQWAKLIDDNFEKYFWIPEEVKGEEEKVVKVKGIYKDILGAFDLSAEYSFRPNFLIAMAVAPEIFNPAHAQVAITKVSTELITETSIGIKSLHSKDKAYKPKYDNNDGTDPCIALGQSYHMGTEWVWLLKYFVRAFINFMPFKNQKEIEKVIERLVKNNKKHLNESLWMSLPELTNAGGEINAFSCMAQSCSVAAIIEVLYALHKRKI